MASAAVLLVGVVTLAAFILSSNGYPVRHVDLNDGGIWVTSDQDGLFGRLNRPAGELDAAFYPPGGAQQSYQLDIGQDGSDVVAWDRAGGKLMPVDVSRGVTLTEQAVAVSAGEQMAIGGGTVAVLDPATGRVWASRADAAAGVDSLSRVDAAAPTVATLGRDAGKAALAVGIDGSVYAAGVNGVIATVRPDGTDFAKAEYRNVGKHLDAVQMTAVGTVGIAFDPSSGSLYLNDGRPAQAGVSDPGAVLQQPGQSDATVVVATTRALVAVDLSSSKATTLYHGADGSPAAPVRLGECLHAAWAGASGGYVRSCDGAPATPGNLKDGKTLLHPVFRVNRNAIVLNDLATGAVWDLQRQAKVDDWSSVKPPPEKSTSDKNNNQDNAQAAENLPPKAMDDTLGARPGQTTSLHVLDNDSDPAGNILSISSVTAPDNPAAVLSIAPDGQTVLVAMPARAGDVHFKYTVDDGKGLNATAAVTVQSRALGQDEQPAPRAGAPAITWTVAAAGRLQLPVLGDWRDFDGDPVVLVEASATGGTATTGPDGSVIYTAPKAGGTQTVNYQVSDGIDAPVSASFAVTVQSPSSTNGIAPTTAPDVARGQVDQPIIVRPLENDLPGSDPTNPAAKLAIAGTIASPAGTVVDTDTTDGTLTVTANRAGTFLLTYNASFGNAPFAKGSVRIDVTAPPDSPQPPVAMPDNAVLHGQTAALVDVLANDFDPSGDVLAVQHAAEDGNGQSLQVAVVRGRWLRINALNPSLPPGQHLIRYTVTDGITSPVTGEVSVTQLPPPANDIPAPQDDYATVRAGDIVTIPVLDNDSDPAGDQLDLVGDVTGAPHPGQLSALADNGQQIGSAYVAGGVVRYVAPDSVANRQTLLVAYTAQNPAGDQATGYAHVTVVPAPSATNPDRVPTPSTVDARVVAGDTVTLTVPTTGVDPDGDSVAVTGLNGPTTLGRITAIGATSLTYQAYPTSTGTDSFGYSVVDRFGKAASASIRVAVVPPGDPQPPVAADDTATAAPGAHLSIDILANDLISADDDVTVEPLARTNKQLPDGVSLASAQGPVTVTAAQLTGKPLIVSYGVSDGLGSPSVGVLTVRSQQGYNVPPVTVDSFAAPQPGADTVDVDVLAKDSDPDGDSSRLVVDQVFDKQAKVSAGHVTVPVLDHPQAVPYEVRDEGGARAVGLIHVPAKNSGAPYATAGKTITVPADGSQEIKLADYVTDPAGKPLRLTTTDKIWASPAAGLAVRNDGEQKLVLTAHAGYGGPAAATFEVTDGTSLTDPHGQTAIVSVPVQVGKEAPVLRCPTSPITVIEGGATASLNVLSVCHVWVADRGSLSSLTFSASWKTAVSGVDLGTTGPHTVTASANGSAKPGSTGVITVSARGFAASADIPVVVQSAASPSLAAITVDGVKAGDTETVDLGGYLRSQLRDPVVTAITVAQASGMSATASASGSTVRLTPASDAHGTITFTVVASDVTDRNRTDRRASGLITLHVLGVPDAPGAPTPGNTVLSRSVELAWTAPANNGAPITSYEVDYSGGSQTCQASPCTITGLSNGTSYTFTVKAINLVGAGKPSPASAPVEPNTVPGAVTGLATSAPSDGALTLSWSVPPNDGTPVQRYEVTWTGGGHQTVTGTTTTAAGLDNDSKYTFTVIAVNSQGPGPSATVDGQSAGTPPSPPAPTFTATDSADASARAVVVSWTPQDPNGPGPTTYTVTRTGGGSKTVCTNVSTSSCDDDGLANDGTVYTYVVTAANAVGHTSKPSPGAQMEATATPGQITGLSATATGSDGQATIKFDAPASHGASSTVSCQYSGGSCGTWTFPTGGQAGVTETVNGLPNGTTSTITLQDCNGSHNGAYAGNPCDSAVSANVTTYGPIKSLNIATSADAQTVNFTVSVDPNGKAATVTVQTSRQSQTFTTGVGAWSWSGSDNVGYSSSDTINVTVSDPGRASVNGSKTQGTPAPPPPPPPPATVTVSKGAPCGSNCASSCTNASCAYIHVQTANFSGPVTCVFNSQHGNGGFVNTPYGANDSKDSYDWFGYPGQWVSATCGGVTGQMTW
jgi:hypothetical protein